MLAHLVRLPAFREIVEPNVEVFRTDITTKRHALVVITFIQAYFPGLRVTIDLADCDRVLRVQGGPHDKLPVVGIRRLVVALGFAAEVMPD